MGLYIANTFHDLKVRKALAWGAFWKLKKVVKSKAPVHLKINLYKAFCLSIQLYGCEAWNLTEELCKKLNVFQTSCFRIILDISHNDHVTNCSLYSALNEYPLSLSVKQCQLCYVGHSLEDHKQIPLTSMCYTNQHMDVEAIAGGGHTTHRLPPFSNGKSCLPQMNWA